MGVITSYSYGSYHTPQVAPVVIHIQPLRGFKEFFHRHLEMRHCIVSQTFIQNIESNVYELESAFEGLPTFTSLN
jgi:hypothetical protein